MDESGKAGVLGPALATSVMFVATVFAELFRQTGVPSWETVWAEDGRGFYGGTRNAGDLLDEHAGDMQLTGRTIGWAAHAVPVDDVALFYVVAGLRP